MKVIAGARGTGKTRKLLFEARSSGGQVLTVNKRALQAKAEAYGFSIPIYDWNDILYGEYDKDKPLYIDNAEAVFAEYLKNTFELDLKGIDVNLEELDTKWTMA